jgi:hypothetical protein
MELFWKESTAKIAAISTGTINNAAAEKYSPIRTIK